MDAKEFVNLVSEMMTAQADYWKSRTRSDLIRSKNLEARVRKALKDGVSIPVESILEERPDDADQGVQIGLFE